MAAPPTFPAALLGRLEVLAAGRRNPNPSPMSPLPGSPHDLLLRAAFDGNLRLIKKMVRELGGGGGEGEGRGAEKVRAFRDSNGISVPHVSAGRGKLPVCRYLVEELRLDV
nr:unnamed protein product [Digitaria exilis]